MKRSIKTFLSSVLCLVMLMGTVFVPMSVSAENLASIPGAYYSNPEGTRVPEAKLPSNFTMLNKEGVSAYFNPYGGDPVNITIPSITTSTELNFGEDFANLPEDMQALTMYYDFTGGWVNGAAVHDSWGAGFKFVYGDKIVTAHKIGTTVDRVFKGGLLHTEEVVYPWVGTAEYARVNMHGGVWKADPWTVAAGNVDAAYSIDAGSSGYITMKMTKADLVAFLKAEFGEDVDATQIKFTVADHGWGMGGGMNNTTGYFQDIGVVSGTDYDTAKNALDAAWKTEMNFVPTNPVIYKWNPKKGDEQLPWSTYFTNFTFTGYIPDPAEGQNLKMIWWYDAAGSDVRVVVDYTRFCSGLQGGDESVIHFEIGDKRDHTTYYVTLDGYKKKTGYFSDDSLSGNGDNGPYDSYTYGYKVFDIKNKADMDKLRNMWVFRVPYAEKVDPLYIGNMGYVVDFEAFEPKLEEALQASSARVQNAIAKIDAIPENVTLEDAAIVAEARAAYDALDPDNRAEGVMLPNMERKPEALMVNTLTGDETVTRLEKLEAAEAIVLAPVQNAVDELVTVTPASSAAIAEAEEMFNALPESLKNSVNNISYIEEAKEAFNNFKPVAAASQNRAAIGEVSKGIRYTVEFDATYADGTGYTATGYGAVAISSTKYVSGELTIDTTDAVNISAEVPVDSYIETYNFGGVVAIPDGQEETAILVRPYIIYTNDEDPEDTIIVYNTTETASEADAALAASSKAGVYRFY